MQNGTWNLAIPMPAPIDPMTSTTLTTLGVIATMQSAAQFIQEVCTMTPDDPEYKKILNELKNPQTLQLKMLQHYEPKDELLFFKECLCIPHRTLRTQVIHEHHDTPFCPLRI